MTEDTFRWAVGIASWVIVVLFLVQVIAWIVIAYAAYKAYSLVSGLLQKINPLIPRIQGTLAEVQTTVARVTETTNQLTTEVRAVSAAVTASAERVSVIASESAEEIRAFVMQTSADIKAMVSTTSHEVTDLVITSSTQMKGVLNTSSTTAHTSMERLDLAVERTVDRFEETSVIVQDSVLTPIREVAAIVTGIKVALETLLGYPERKPIDQAYQDEELFI